MSNINFSLLSPSLIRSINDDLGLPHYYHHFSFSNSKNEKDQDDEEASILQSFLEKNPSAYITVCRLIITHLNIDPKVFRPNQENAELDEDIDIVPSLSPVDYLSQGAWEEMTHRDRRELMSYMLVSQYRQQLSLFKSNILSFGDNITRLVIGHGKRRVLILVGIHGNEYCGVEAVRHILKRQALFLPWGTAEAEALEHDSCWTTLYLQDLFKSLTMEFIVGNPEAFRQKKRFIQKNLNRLIDLHRLGEPDAEEPCYEKQRARIVMECIHHSDCVLDIHSCSADVPPFALPNSMDVSEELASKLPVRYVVQSLAHQTLDGGTTMDAALLHGIPGICVECGSHHHVNAVATAAHVISKFLVLQSGILSDKEQLPRPLSIKCSCVEKVNPGFRFLRGWTEFEFVPFGTPVFRDDVNGVVRCNIEPGAYLVMPAMNPIVGEEALFWAHNLYKNGNE